MTARTFLQLWPSCVVLVMLLTRLSFPAAPVRRWLADGPHVAGVSEEGPWFVYGGGTDLGPFATRREAAALVPYPQRLRSWASELVTCPWCVGAWVTLVAVLIFANGNVWDRVCWWGTCWLAASGSAVVLDAIADR